MMPIINVRGTSGSGKSTVVNRVMAMYLVRSPVYIAERRQPLLYHCLSGNNYYKPLSVLGHYEIAGGGCDNIKRVEDVYKMVRTEMKDQAVLFEGLMCSEDQKWANKFMDEGNTMNIFHLSTDIEVCLASIRERRARVGNIDPLDETNTRNRVRAINSAVKKLYRATIWTTDRDQTYNEIMRLLRS